MALRVAVTDLWSGAVPDGQLVVQALSATAPVELVAPRDAEVLLFGVFGHRHRRFVGTKVQFSGENTRPAWDAADYSIGHDHLGDARYLRFPHFAEMAVRAMLANRPPPTVVAWPEREFCLFLYTRGTPERAEIMRALSGYRFVTSPGSFHNNSKIRDLEPRDGQWRLSKLALQGGYRFSVAYENTAYPGYTTEKLYDALLTRSIPIYWGNPRVDEDFHPDCMINAADFSSVDALVAHVAEVDQDPHLAAQYLARSDFMVRRPEQYWDDLCAFMAKVVDALGTANRRAQKRRALRLMSRTSPMEIARAVKRRVVPWRRGS